ncbi:hypothetical protein B0G71_1246 [Paraburkholderia sp. BL27I4N3]|uniref:Cap15 family cyclic dinucleotide receptor domain-containing protein n=1 Tax=Paraburkholderia sp. BL27I4N3 TaxID=1938805 RepID=UPI000E2847AF|nr:hypothetical protein [Paraburkholderia sp. BL27I4N3]REE18247.1 hypothetical protein B0G71_1246 [Paraburkholderia sp. BL27I4N3]
MFRIINFVSVLRYVASATTFISLIAYECLRTYWQNDLPLIKVVSIAPLVALAIIFALTTNGISRFIWKSVKRLNSNLFPDLNGTWSGEIVTADGKNISAKAVIRQTLLQMQIDIHTETSKSITLETTPAAEGGQYKIYYLYRSIPKNPEWDEYKGSTIFDIRCAAEGPRRVLELSGAYFTSRKTVGRIRFRQESPDTTTDVSFY